MKELVFTFGWWIIPVLCFLTSYFISDILYKIMKICFNKY